MKVKSESEVAQLYPAQSYPTLSNPMDCSPPGSSIHGIFQARVLEWGATAFSEFLPITMYSFATEANHMRHTSGLSCITAFFLFWKSLTLQLTKMKIVIFQISFLKSFMLKSHARTDYETTNFDTFKTCTKGCCLEATDQWVPFGISSFTYKHHPHVFIYTVLYMTHSCRMYNFVVFISLCSHSKHLNKLLSCA